MNRHWMELSTTEMSAQSSRTVVVLPVAAIEQHGPHLPLGTDVYINRGMIARALELLPGTVPALVLPEQTVGASPEHLRFAGTLTHRPSRILEYWAELLEGVHRAGFSRVVIYNTHGGNKDLLYPLAVDLRSRLDMIVAFCSRSDAGMPEGVLEGVPNLSHDIHGGAIETSIMLALHPDLVARDRIADFASEAIAYPSRYGVLGAYPGNGRAAGFGWMSQDLNRDGACGDARIATPEIGRALVDHGASALAKVIEDVWGATDLLR